MEYHHANRYVSSRRPQAASMVFRLLMLFYADGPALTKVQRIRMRTESVLK